MAPLHQPFPVYHPLAKPAANPAADKLLSQVNRAVNGIRRNKLAAKTAELRIAECERELQSLQNALQAMGVRTETDPHTGLVNLVRGEAGRIDEHFNTELSPTS